MEQPLPRWLKEPIIGLTFTDWCTQVLTSLLLHGNSYIVVTRNERAQILELTPVDPQSVSVDRSGTMGGRKRYIVRGQPFTGEMVHIKGMMLPGADVGLSPLEFAIVSELMGARGQPVTKTMLWDRCWVEWNFLPDNFVNIIDARISALRRRLKEQAPELGDELHPLIVSARSQSLVFRDLSAWTG